MRLTVQLYTVRDALSHDLEGTLKKLREIGLEYVELAGDYGKSGAEWKEMLESVGLKASGAHIGLDQIESDLDGTIEFANQVGFDLVIVPWIGSDAYANGWAAFGSRLEPFAQKLSAAGLQLAYHNHDFEYANGDGLTEMYAAAPSVKAEVDAAWVKIGGYDPTEVIQRLGDRVVAIHGKDSDAAKTPRWTPAGAGEMPLADIVKTGQSLNVKYIAIELDESPGSPMDAVAESYAYYASLGLN
jgi:sugar phosphate isomerase/epimerase